MNTQNNTLASRNEEAVALNITREGGASIRVTSIRAMPHGFMAIGEHGMPYKFKGERAHIRLAFDKTSAAAPSAAPGAAVDARGQEAGPIELRGIAETLENQDGCWRSCSGCHELNEGHDTGPYSAVLKCHLGSGCSECGGIGAIWDTTDYADMAAHALASHEETPAASAQDFSGDFVEHSHPQFGAGFFCTPDVFERITSTAPSEALSPATVAQPAGLTMEQAKSLASSAIYDSDGRGMNSRSRTDLTNRVARAIFKAAQPCASQGCGGAPEYWIPADSNGVFTGRWMRSLALTDKEKASGDWIPLIRAALSTAKSGGGATPEGGEA